MAYKDARVTRVTRASRLFVYNLVDGVDVGTNGRADDIGGETCAGVDTSAYAQTNQRAAHSLFFLSDGADGEVVELKVTPGDLLYRVEGGVDRAVAYGYALQGPAVAVESDLRGGSALVAAVDDLALDGVGSRHL